MSKDADQFWTHRRFGLCALVAGALLAGCGDSKEMTAEQIRTVVTAVAPTEEAPRVRPRTEAPSGTLVIRDLEVGAGAVAREGDRLTTQFVAVRMDGEPFESTWDQGRSPFSFSLGGEEASPGWERGLRGMRVGGRRELVVPPRLSSRFGVPADAGPEDSIVYVIDLIRLRRPGVTGRGEPQLEVPGGSPPRRLQVRDLIAGEGAEAERGDVLTVEYVADRWDGTRFTNSWERAKPFSFELGARSVWINPGWQRGLEGMRVGGRRQLVIPPALQYEGGAPPGASPDDTLVYIVDLISISRGSAAAEPDEEVIAKGAFVKQADRICTATSREIVTESVAVVRATQREGGSRHEAETGIVSELLIPGLEGEIEAIRGLGYPSGDEEEIEAILAALGDAVEEARSEPETYIQAGGEYRNGSVHFGRATKLARAYGLKSCPVG